MRIDFHTHPVLIQKMVYTPFARIFPEDENYHHRRYLDYYGRLGFNAERHLKSILAGISCSFPIEKVKVRREWRQTVFFTDLYSPFLRT